MPDNGSSSYFSVDYTGLDEGSATMLRIASQIEDKLAALKGDLSQIVWQGNDRDAYNQAQRDWDNAIADLNGVLVSIVNGVRTARDNYQDTERANTNVWVG